MPAFAEKRETPNHVFSPLPVALPGKLLPCGRLTSVLLAVTTELQAKWPSAQHPSCQRRKVKHKSRKGLT